MFLYIIFVVTLIIFLYKYTIEPYKYWKHKKVKYLKPKPFLGSMEIIKSVSFTELLEQMYNSFPNDRYFGLYQFLTPIFMLRDCKLIKKISVKDFDSFMDHTTFSSEEIDPLWNKNLLQMYGEKWRIMRNTLSPAFTSSKMRQMFVLMETCAKQVINYMTDQNQTIYEVEMKDFCSRFANDVIATCAFGINCDSMKKPKNDFYLMGQKASDFSGLRAWVFFLNTMNVTLVKLLKLRLIPTDVEDFFSVIIRKALKLRRDQGLVRKDMINLLLDAQKGRLKHEDNPEPEIGFSTNNLTESVSNQKSQTSAVITDDDIVAQAFIFFLGGFNTTSGLLSFVAYELATNPDVQAKVIQEIDENCKEEITYETIVKLKYLDMVICETLRMWPPVNLNDRKVSKDIVIEPEQEGELPVYLEKGTLCWIPVSSIHRDPKNFPNPNKFDPERFSDENKRNIDSGAFMPFGLGPRACIGSRFALLETKVLFANLLKSFQIVPTEKTKIPLVLDRYDLAVSCDGGMWLGFKQRNSIL